ncbi:Zn-ribbon domain-containing OB-fold protein [Variovorax sp. PBL-E5]|uniref:Zn-ribbon domain-containing OB-fold protein n=1 Tax=Variovorax sp. PBL-E5 TaxID=434014 RepID=UPI00131835F4|nr:zinc ribbon domain-containing protein [Variovorax sp. PBL-E5]VTU37466.1 putative nucleic-acid-binding protein containing a Zn-ribbon [Variovorax sp. PBL-E5]
MSTEIPVRKIPAPLVNPEAQPFFDAAAEGRLVYKHCDACGQAHHPPRGICPHCHSDRTAWKSSAGLGSVYSASLLRKGVPVPYCVAYVTLDEGVTLMSDLSGFGDSTPPVGTRVKVCFVEADGGVRVPMFGPAEAS